MNGLMGLGIHLGRSRMSLDEGLLFCCAPESRDTCTIVLKGLVLASFLDDFKQGEWNHVTSLSTLS